MDCGTVWIEVVRGLFSAPFIFGSLILYFLLKHRSVVSTIIQRITSISLPGGMKFDTPYPATPDSPTTIQAVPPKPSDKGQEKLPGKTDIPENFEENFRAFLSDGIRTYQVFINADIDLMYQKLTSGPAFVLSGLPIAETREKKFQAIREPYNVADRAVRDYYEINSKPDTSSTQRLITTYNKAVVLHEYLFRHHDTRL